MRRWVSYLLRLDGAVQTTLLQQTVSLDRDVDHVFIPSNPPGMLWLASNGKLMQNGPLYLLIPLAVSDP